MTPAGRQRYMEILYEHIRSQKAHFDEWHLLVNTANVPDIGFCERLAAREDWIETKYLAIDPARGIWNISLFVNEFCRDPDAVYLRLDDDIVYLAPDFVRSMFEFRQRDQTSFLVYGNIINNAIIAWLHQKLGNFKAGAHSRYDVLDETGWKDPWFAHALHAEFLKDPKDPKWTSFQRWVATEYERISVNAICWFGRDLQECACEDDEEVWFACVRPSQLGRPNTVNGSAVCAHFAFQPQREVLERETDVLDRYRQLTPAAADDPPAPAKPAKSAKAK